ncbi:MAG: DUF4142 domain-containing protein [Sphingobium sp.]
MSCKIPHILLPFVTMLAACGQGSQQEAGSGPANGSATVAKVYEGPKPEGVSSTHDAVTRTYYIPATANSDAYEIEASKLALKRATRPDVKAFAQQMLDHHTRTSQDLRSFVANNPVNIAIPSNMDARHRAMIDNLTKASDQEFDKEYVGQQAAAHQEALNLQKSYGSRGDDKKLSALAQRTAGVIEQHVKQIAALEKAVGTGSNAP